MPLIPIAALLGGGGALFLGLGYFTGKSGEAVKDTSTSMLFMAAVVIAFLYINKKGKIFK